MSPAAEKHQATKSAIAARVVLGLVFALPFVGALALHPPRAAGGSSAATTTTPTTDPAATTATNPSPAPDPAPTTTAKQKVAPSPKTKPPTSYHIAPVTPPPVAPARSTSPSVTPTPVYTPAAAATHTDAPASVTTHTAHRAAKRRKAPLHAPPSSQLERPYVVPALATSSVPSAPSSPSAPAQNTANQVSTPSSGRSIARIYIVALDCIAVLLLGLAALPAGFVRERLGSTGALRFRPSVAAAGFSLLSVSLVLFMFGLAGPVP